MKTLKITFTLIGIILVIILGIAYMAAYKTLHKERQEILKTPKDYGLQYENIAFLNPDGNKLKGWWIEGTTDKVIIVAHGYGANRAGWSGTDKEGVDKYLDWLGVAPALVKEGYSMLYFDMRASGESEGDLITLGKMEADDFLSAIHWQLKNKGKKKIGLLGFSMGANTVLRAGIKTINLEKQNKVADFSIIAIGPYKYDTMVNKSLQYWTSLPSFFSPLIKKSAKLILGFNPSKEIDPTKYINKLGETPILFIQSELDEIGDVKDVQDIYDTYKGQKEIIIIPNAKRFIHYNYPKNNPKIIINFYNKTLKKHN